MELSNRQITALKKSIEHWEANAKAVHPTDKNVGVDADFCALCKNYFENNCKSCPVALKVNSMFCRNTPYPDAALAFEAWERSNEMYSFDKNKKLFRKSAKVMVKFLKSLLPDDN